MSFLKVFIGAPKRAIGGSNYVSSGEDSPQRTQRARREEEEEHSRMVPLSGSVFSVSSVVTC